MVTNVEEHITMLEDWLILAPPKLHVRFILMTLARVIAPHRPGPPLRTEPTNTMSSNAAHNMVSSSEVRSSIQKARVSELVKERTIDRLKSAEGGAAAY